jgi:hypothetical protein
VDVTPYTCSENSPDLADFFFFADAVCLPARALEIFIAFHYVGETSKLNRASQDPSGQTPNTATRLNSAQLGLQKLGEISFRLLTAKITTRQIFLYKRILARDRFKKNINLKFIQYYQVIKFFQTWHLSCFFNF